MRTALALLLACLLLVTGCTSTEQAADVDVPGPAVEEAAEVGRPYEHGDDLAEWLTEDEAAEMIRPFADRHGADLSEAEVVLSEGFAWDTRPIEEVGGDGRYRIYHYVLGEDVDPVFTDAFYWGLTVATGSIAVPEDPETWAGEEHELLPDGVRVSQGAVFCEFQLQAPEGEFLYLKLHEDDTVLTDEEVCRAEALPMAAQVLRELGWVD